MVSFHNFNYVPDEQHRLVLWRRAFGEETGMNNELALRSEALVSNNFAQIMEQQAGLLRQDRPRWLALFRERYTSARMITYSKARLNVARPIKSEANFIEEARKFVFDKVNLSLDQLEEHTLFDTMTGLWTDKGICLILAAVGELTPNDEIRALAPEYFN